MAITSRNTRTVTARNYSESFVMFRRGPAGIAIEVHDRDGDWESADAGPFDLAELRRVLDQLSATPEEPLGGYTRHEKHDADDFANAEFARHPSGRFGARIAPDGQFPWRVSYPGDKHDWHTDEGMVANGWSPVRECPDPEQHTSGPFDLAAIFRDERDTARAMAALWKEATRREVRKVHSDDGLVMRAIRAAQTLSAQASILQGEVEKAERERDELRSLYEGQIEVIGRLQRAADPRPLTPDAITDEMVQRARRRGIELQVDFAHTGAFWATKQVLTAALTEPPKRPEGAEEIEAILAELPDTMMPATDAGRADLLASRGVRAPEERS